MAGGTGRHGGRDDGPRRAGCRPKASGTARHGPRNDRSWRARRRLLAGAMVRHGARNEHSSRARCVVMAPAMAQDPADHGSFSAAISLATHVVLPILTSFLRTPPRDGR